MIISCFEGAGPSSILEIERQIFSSKDSVCIVVGSINYIFLKMFLSLFNIWDHDPYIIIQLINPFFILP